VPSTVDAPTVADPTAHPFGVIEETEADAGERVQRRPRTRLAHDRDQQPGDVVGAVAVLASRHGVVGVLEHPD
jgi:hypothetical protein